MQAKKKRSRRTPCDMKLSDEGSPHLFSRGGGRKNREALSKRSRWMIVRKKKKKRNAPKIVDAFFLPQADGDFSVAGGVGGGDFLK